MSDEPNTPSSEQPAGDESSPVGGAPAAESSPPAEYFQLKKADLRAELLRLEREDPAFANELNTLVGRKAATKWQPEVESARAEAERYRRAARRLEILQMDPKDIEQRFDTDAAFAKEYAELVHEKPGQAQVVDETPRIVAAWNDAIEDAMARGVSQKFIDGVATKASQGGYGRDDEHWTTSMSRVQRDLNNEIDRVRTEKHKEAAPKTNEALQGGGPDLTRGAKATPGAFPTTVQDFNRLPWAQQKELTSTPEGQKQLDNLIAKASR